MVAEKSGKGGVLAIDMAAANRVPARGEELVLVVMRFEYALKEIGYGKMGAGGAVEAKWDEFVNKELTSDFLKHVRENNIAPTILGKPPSRQILNGMEGRLTGKQPHRRLTFSRFLVLCAACETILCMAASQATKTLTETTSWLLRPSPS
jgi:hypothetical protein